MVTQFAAAAINSPSFTTIAANGPPRPERTFSSESSIARLIHRESPLSAKNVRPVKRDCNGPHYTINVTQLLHAGALEFAFTSSIATENDRTFRRQNAKSATPIKINAALNPIHNPGAPHPTAKHK